jgi:hypothetical protein
MVEVGKPGTSSSLLFPNNFTALVLHYRVVS